MKNKIICEQLFDPNNSSSINLNLNDTSDCIVDLKHDSIANNWYLLTETNLFACNQNGSLCKKLNNEIFMKPMNILVDSMNR